MEPGAREPAQNAGNQARSQDIAAGCRGTSTPSVPRRALVRPGARIPTLERSVACRNASVTILGEAPCDLCSVNQGAQYSRRSHVVAVSATRLGVDGADEVVLGRKSISSMVDVEPFESLLDCLGELPEAAAGHQFDNY